MFFFKIHVIFGRFQFFDRRFRCFLISLILLGSLSVSADPLHVVIPPWGTNAQNMYFPKLLALAFAKTEATDGPVDIQVYPGNLSSARFMADLKNKNTVDIVWNGSNKQREQELLPIYISLLKNLNEYRVLLIRKDDQQKFNAIHSLDDLRKMTAGTGADWPSTEILRSNDLPVITVGNASLLFSMLTAKRFDYMSRNLSEVWGEADAFEKNGLVIEDTLILHGGVPFYFFVNKDNKRLAERVERGLKIAIADGSFDQLFFSTPGFKRGSEEIASAKRRVLQLSTK